MITIAIDPGLTGALAMIDHHGLQACVDMPIMAKSSGTVKNQVNAAALSSLLSEWINGHDKNEVMVLMEVVRAMPKQGSSSTFSLGHTSGIIEGVVAAKGLPHEMVTPQTWKKHFGLDSDKEKARTLAQRLYPEASLARMRDHNRSEAILLARYGYEKHARRVSQEDGLSL